MVFNNAVMLPLCLECILRYLRNVAVHITRLHRNLFWYNRKKGHFGWGCVNVWWPCTSTSPAWDYTKIVGRLVGFQDQIGLVHDDVMIWKRFPYYLPFVRGMDSPPKDSLMPTFGACLLLVWKKKTVEETVWLPVILGNTTLVWRRYFIDKKRMVSTWGYVSYRLLYILWYFNTTKFTTNLFCTPLGVSEWG